MPDLVTLEEAKAQVRERTDARDDELQATIDEATEIVLNYIARPDATWTATIAAWEADTAPKEVIRAIKMLIAELDRFRGDDVETPKQAHGYLTPAIVALLHRYRDPVLA